MLFWSFAFDYKLWLEAVFFRNLQEECKHVSSEGQNLRLDLSNKFQDAIKVWKFFCSEKTYLL